MGAAPRGGKIDLATVVFDGRGAQDLLGDTGDEVLGEFHHVGVVGVGPVELQHRELGIVPSRHAFVAEQRPISNTFSIPPTTSRFR